MKLQFINGSVQSIVEYLPKLQLKGRENRARQKLLKKSTEKFQEFYSDVQEIKSEHPDDEQKQNKELDTLLKEEITLDMTEYAHLMPALYDALLDYPHEIDSDKVAGKPSDAAVHDYLIDVLEAEIEEAGAKDNGVEDAQFQEVE